MEEPAACLIYGANGYTGELIAREAVRRKLRPVLAGRNHDAVVALAKELELDCRVFSLDDPAAVAAGIRGSAVVLHCAGPFAHTANVMVNACLAEHVHYLDITGEVSVFEALHARDQEAQRAGVMLLPGAGCDVVPTDCLAAHLKRRLPTATQLTLGLAMIGGMSRGTATTMTENLHRGGLVRRGGVLNRVPAAWKTGSLYFESGVMKAMTIPWGDLSTAYYSTGIPNIEVYMAAPRGFRLASRLSRYFAWALGSAPVQRFMKKRIQSGPPGPTPAQRERGKCLFWGQVHDDSHNDAASRMCGPEGYTLTALTALAVVERVLAGKAPPGFQTPALAYGPDFILEIPGMTRQDL